jgi:hypothetical protein
MATRYAGRWEMLLLTSLLTLSTAIRLEGG